MSNTIGNVADDSNNEEGNSSNRWSARATAYCIRLLAGFKQRHGRTPQRQEWDELASDIAGKFKMPLDKKKLIEKKNRMKIDYEAWKYL